MKRRNPFGKVAVRLGALAAFAAFAALLPLSPARSLPWSFDMWSQDSVQPYEAPVVYPRNSVSTDGSMVRLEDRQKVEAVKKGPVPPTAESVARGEKLFEYNCVVCHGPKGEGDGIIIKKGLGFYPVNLAVPAVRARSDGYIYAYIRYGGKVMMPAYGENISEEDAWHVVNYVRKLQGGVPGE